MTESPRSVDEWLAFVEARHPGWHLGLERVAEVGARLDVLHPASQVVLVAGTNGKGSTCEYLTALAMKAGLRVGTSTSPHFFRFNERVRIDGVPVADATLIDAFERIEAAAGDIHLTQFEFASLASLVVFREAALDLAVLEIGLGGRLDAMNIVTPDLSVITAIALDHQEWLGDTRDVISLEKAGIMRPGVTCVHSDREPTTAILDHAEQHRVPMKLIGRDFDIAEDVLTVAGEQFSGLPEPSLPEDSLAAAAMGLTALGFDLRFETDPQALRDVAATTSMVGRGQVLRRNCNVLLDVAHNPSAAARLAIKLGRMPSTGAVHAVTGIYKDKDMAGVIGPLAPLVDAWHLPPLTEKRGASPEVIADILATQGAGSVRTYAKIASAMQAALGQCQEEDTLLVFGSFPVVAGALRFLEATG